MLIYLLSNAIVVGFFVLLWSALQDWSAHQQAWKSNLLLGLLMGGAAIVAMLAGESDSRGILVDFRTVAITLAGFFGGPLAATVATLAAAPVRLAIGGIGTSVGLAQIGLAAIFGLLGWFLSAPREPRPRIMLLVALLNALVTVVSAVILPEPERSLALQPALMAFAFLAFAKTFLSAYVIAYAHRRAVTRALFVGAIEQSPDYMYVKDIDSVIVAGSASTASVNGLPAAMALVGKTDFDFADPIRAAQLFEEEQDIIRMGGTMANKCERLIARDGAEHIYLTSKSAVRLAGRVIGLVGVTKDITAMKAKEKELEYSHDRLSFVLQEMSDGVALISHKGYIILANDRYRELFPRTGALRTAGAFYPTILEKTFRSGEQPVIDDQHVEDWIAEMMHTVRHGGDEIIQLFDGRWLLKRIRSHPSGFSTVVVSDITTVKRAELDLLAMTKKLETLAMTDGLTRLTNRRGFDETLEREVARARRTDKPISVVLIDIDRFKSYNDRYGHLAGDDCLRRVAQATRSSLKRPTDLVARYGGEELAMVLPDTGAQGAYFVAETVRKAVFDLGCEHQDSEKGVVTVSIGVASLEGIDPEISSSKLFAMADQALYLAKGGGRNRTVVYEPPAQQYPMVAYI